MNIQTSAIKNNGLFVGWKVYINGNKFPRKPEEYYKIPMGESEAVMKAMDDCRKEIEAKKK